MKKILILLLSIAPFSTFADDVVFNNPTFWDLGTINIQNSIWVLDSDLIWKQETWDINWDYFFCQSFGYNLVSSSDSSSWNFWVSYWDSSNWQWQYDGNQVIAFSQIICDNLVNTPFYWCTQDNALNYSSLANEDDWSCFYTDVDNEIVINSKGWISEDIFTKDEIYNLFQLEFVIMLVFTLIICIQKLSPQKQKRFKISNIFK